MPRVRADNDARYALRASFVDENGEVLDAPITISSSTQDPRISDTDIANWNTTYAEYLPYTLPVGTGGSVVVGIEDNYWRWRLSGTSEPQGIRLDAYDNPVFTVTRGGDVTATSFTGDGSGLTGISAGINASDNVNITGHWEFQDNYELRFGNSADIRMDFNGSDFLCRSYNHGARLLFQGERSSDGSNRALLYLDPDGEASIYHSGSKKGYTYSSGWRVTGNLLATSDVYAYYSDRRLKDVVGRIEKPLESVGAIETFYYTHNDKARELGYEGSERQVGVSAQSVQAVLPEVIGRAPIDDDGEGGSVTGEDYITVKYERIVPLLIEAIKELTDRVEELERDR